MYATGPILSRISNGPQNLACQFGATSQLQGTPVSLHFQENMVTHFEFSMGSVTVSVTFLPILGNFQIPFNPYHLVFHLFEQFNDV
jgi:hypothetical protein